MKRWKNRLGLASIALSSSLLAQPAWAGDGILSSLFKKECATCPQPSEMYIIPPHSVTAEPSPVPSQQQQPSETGEQQATPPAEASTPDLFSATSFASTAAVGSATFSPNMFGDQFGGGMSAVNGLITVPGQLDGQPGTAVFTPANTIGPGAVAVPIGGSGTVVFMGNDLLTVGPLPDNGGGVALSESLNPDNTFNPSPAVNAALNGPFAPLVAAGILSAEQAMDPSVVSGTGSVTVGDTGTFDSANSQLIYPLTFSSMVDKRVIFNVPSPSGGGVVGRTKIADDNSPMPRDRVIFNYDYFNNTTLAANGWDVHRFSPGIEKTFFDQRASLEVRIPFAGTLNSDLSQGAETSNTEFGNINVTAKALLWRGDFVNVASGLAISLPTADDTRVSLANGVDLVRIENEAVILTPYIAALFTPTDRLFAQTWAAFAFDAKGNTVQLNNAMLGMQNVGQINDQTLMQLDAQIGYWLVQNNDGLIRGLAPFIELHYNTTLNDADLINANGVIIGNLAGNIDELNLTAGVSSQIGDNLNLAIGAVAPLKGGDDRFFDYQIGVRASWFFGATSRDRSSTNYISSF